MKTYFSPAKLNLFFRVLARRSDGFHQIASLYQAIDLFDTLTVAPALTTSFTCSDPRLPCDSSNLIVKAFQLFNSRFTLPFGVRISLEKKIPLQAGLGGGSSNAATLLWALNELTGSPFTLEELMNMGASLGSDVSFFFSLGTAYCTGRGEVFTPFQLPRALVGYLFTPPFGLSTPLVYRETKVEELPLRDPIISLKQYPCFYNDLEPAAFRLEPRLFTIRQKLKEMGFENVAMTGSGTTFFCFDIDKKKGNLTEEGLTPFCSIVRSSSSWYTPSY